MTHDGVPINIAYDVNFVSTVRLQRPTQITTPLRIQNVLHNNKKKKKNVLLHETKIMNKDKKVYFIEKRERLATGAPVMRSILRIPRRGGARRGQMSPKETTPLTPCRHLQKTEQSSAARDQSGSSSETSKWRREAQARLNPRVHPVTARTSRVPTARRTLRRFRVTRRPNRPDTPLALDSKGSPGAILRGTCPLYASFESPLYLFKCKDGEQKRVCL